MTFCFFLYILRGQAIRGHALGIKVVCQNLTANALTSATKFHTRRWHMLQTDLEFKRAYTRQSGERAPSSHFRPRRRNPARSTLTPLHDYCAIDDRCMRPPPAPRMNPPNISLESMDTRNARVLHSQASVNSVGVSHLQKDIKKTLDSDSL